MEKSPASSHMYGIYDPPFTNLMKDWMESASVTIEKEFADKIRFVQGIVDMDYAIASYYMTIATNPNAGELPRRSEVLISAYHRNWFALMASYDLTCKGLFGPARSILRHVFESMIIAKFCSLSNDDTVYKKWLKGDTVYFTNSVLKKISKPDIKVFSEFWSTLSNFVHATIYAQQFSLAWEHIRSDTHFNFDLILVLLEWHYHILTSHIITPITRYYTAYSVSLLGQEKAHNLQQLKKQLRHSFTNAKKPMPDFMRKAASDFRKTWVLLP